MTSMSLRYAVGEIVIIPAIRVIIRHDTLSEKFKYRIALPTSAGLKPVRVSDIVYIEVTDHYSRVYLRSGHFDAIDLPLTKILKRLSPEYFRQIHKSIIVSLDDVALIANDKETVFMNYGKAPLQLSIGRTYKDAFLEAYDIWSE